MPTTSGSEATRSGRAVLLHGFTGSARSWDEEGLVACFEPRGIDAIAIDLPGHGSRGGPRGRAGMSLETTLEEIDRALEPSVDGSPRHLIGYSMGGRLALHYAVHFPGRLDRLVLESSSPGLEGAVERARRRAADESLASRLESEGIEAFVDGWEALPLFASQGTLPDEARARLRAGRLANDPRSLAQALRTFGTGALPSLWNELPRVEAEVLLLVGELDWKFVEIAERMVTRLPRGEVTVVPGAGHTVHLEAHDRWCEVVTDFLTSA